MAAVMKVKLTMVGKWDDSMHVSINDFDGSDDERLTSQGSVGLQPIQ